MRQATLIAAGLANRRALISRIGGWPKKLLYSRGELAHTLVSNLKCRDCGINPIHEHPLPSGMQSKLLLVLKWLRFGSDRLRKVDRAGTCQCEAHIRSRLRERPLDSSIPRNRLHAAQIGLPTDLYSRFGARKDPPSLPTSQAEIIIDRDDDLLLRAQIPLGRLNGRVAELSRSTRYADWRGVLVFSIFRFLTTTSLH
jgi:hypothetical protein